MSKRQELRDSLTAAGVKYVNSRGNNHARLWVIGSHASGADASSGYAFADGAGRELDRMCQEAGINPYHEVFFHNVYPVCPPDGDIDNIEKLGVPRQLYVDAILEELNEGKPPIIVVCGRPAFTAVLPEYLSHRDGAAKIDNWRGSLLSSNLLEWPHYAIPSYPPDFVQAVWEERPVAIFCLARAKEELDHYLAQGKLKPLTERQLIVNPPYSDVKDYLREVSEQKDPIAHDIETFKRKWPYTISVASNPYRAISFSFWNYEITELVEIWRLLDNVLRTHEHVGQNWLDFDCHHLERLGFRPNHKLAHDTMVQHHVLWPEFPHKLQFLTFQYTREPYYKDEGKEWKPKEGLERLMRYNCKDTCIDLEAFYAMKAELAERNLTEFYEYRRHRDWACFNIEKRGIMIDPRRLAALKQHILEELNDSCRNMTKITNMPVAYSKDEADKRAKDLKVAGLPPNVLNAGSATQLKKLFPTIGLKVPKDRMTGKETTGEEHLQKLFATTGHPFIKELLRTRELSKILGTCVNAKLDNNVLYTQYVSTGTVSGRLSSRKNVFDLGSNLQNIPHHSELGEKYRETIVPRPGKIFVQADQATAEDWVVQGIIANVSGNMCGIDELRSGEDRHTKTACFIFSLPRNSKTPKEWKASPERYLGKKTRHACNYDMQGPTMSLALAKECYHIPAKQCDMLITKFHQMEPLIKGVFHQYVQDQLIQTRRLISPTGWERVFFGLRPFSNNHKVFKEAYSWIPQNTVADNNGRAEVFIEENNQWSDDITIIMETHDSITLEVTNTPEFLIRAVRLLEAAYHRTIRFPDYNHFEFEIPIDIEISTTNLREMIKCVNLTDLGLTVTWTGLNEPAKALANTTSGVQQL